MRFHHVGVVVKSISPYSAVIAETFKSQKTTVPFHDTIQRVNVSFIDLGGFSIELIEPAERQTPITSFLERNGEGIHHLAFEVDDIEAAVREMDNRGGKVVCPPVKGFDDRLISFIFMNTLPFKLVELVSKKSYR